MQRAVTYMCWQLHLKMQACQGLACLPHAVVRGLLVRALPQTMVSNQLNGIHGRR